MRRLGTCIVLAGAIAVMGCSEEQQNPVSPEAGVADVELSAAKGGKKGGGGAEADEDSRILMETMVQLNDRLEAEGMPYRVEAAQWIAAPDAERQGQTVLFDDRGNKQLDLHFLADDPRRAGGTDVTYLVDESDGATLSGLSSDQTTAAIDRAMDTWESTTSCSNLAITKLADPGVDVDLIDFLLGAGPEPDVALPVADIVHGGWLPASVLGPNTLAVTFTFTFTEDLNDDGNSEVAFREIYYNNLWLWEIDAPIPAVDVESVALHEAGHGLSQDHFGKAFVTDANGKLHFAPFALMNAGYTQLVQGLEGTDRAGHCSIWGSWPNN